ncbi:MAG: 8-oxoguanine deaminase [Chloroflexota bacterium]|nr:8-oxoguanine deaminase [Chloroflexota bacterium]
MTSLLLADCRLVVCVDDGKTELQGAWIGIEESRIVYLDTATPARAFDDTLDCSRMIALPGLVNTHHHLYQTLTRGFPQSEGAGLFDWLRLLYPIWAGLDEEMIYTSTRTGLAELALSGCTTCADHLYVFPAGSESFMDAQIEAARSIGIRFHATRGSMDLGRSEGGLPPDSVVQPSEVILRDSERVIERYHDRSPGAMLQIGLAPCSPFSVTPELMRESARLARSQGVRLHTHIAETTDEHRFSMERFGISPVELLGTVGWLAGDVWVAHCVHPSEGDIRRLAGAQVSVAHCPTSNMLLGSGLAPTKQFMEAGVNLGLGVDGSASNDSNDLRQEIKQAILSARVRDGATALSVRAALWMATRGGAACLGREDIGSLEVGKVADVVLFDCDALRCAGAEEDLVAGVVLGGVRPDTVLVGGRTVVMGGRLQELDEIALAASHNTASRRLLERWRAAGEPLR